MGASNSATNSSICPVAPRLPAYGPIELDVVGRTRKSPRLVGTNRSWAVPYRVRGQYQLWSCQKLHAPHGLP